MRDPWPITLAGVLMDYTPDDEGVRWRVADVEGWDSPPVRVDDGDLTGRHGGFGPARLYGARLLTVSGAADSPDMATAWRVRDRLHAMPSVASTASLTVHESVPKSVTVMLGGEPRSSWPLDNFLHRVTFQLRLTAHDPFKKGQQRTLTVGAGATVTATHLGTAAADLRATVTSAGTVQLTAGGLTLTTSSLPVGAVIDTASCTVTGPDGADLYGAVAAFAQFPALPAGGGPVTQAGTASLDITYRDTYA